MKTKQEFLNTELSKGKSIVNWVMGYYNTGGNEFSPSLKIPIFGFIEQSKFNTMVLVDYLGSMMWINLYPHQVNYGHGGENAPSPMGKELRRKLESLKV
jgi:hypothetical protein